MNHNDFFKLIAADGLRGAYLLQELLMFLSFR